MGENQNKSEQNSSMEELKMDEDENVKEISVEDDILGAQSLLLSESDEETTNCNFQISQSPQKNHKKSKRILESDNENDFEDDQISVQTNIELNHIINKQKISTLIDSDSEDETHNFFNGTYLNARNLSTKINKAVQDYSPTNAKALKRELNLKLGKKTKIRLKKGNKNFPQVSLDSNDPSIEKCRKLEKNILEQKSNNNCATEKSKEVTEHKKHLSLIDSESSDAGSEKEVNESDLESSARAANSEINKNTKKKIKTSKVVRASAKKAMDEMQAIQSEQQRLHREAHITIPYHKAKKHTLDEFLMRRTVIKPLKSSSIATAIQTRSPKMTTEELQEYAKLMDERAEEATQFFKSESESEEDKPSKMHESVVHNDDEITEENINLRLPLPNKIFLSDFYDDHNNATDLDDLYLKEGEIKTVLAEEDRRSQIQKKEMENPSYSKVIITEVIELPKLDMKTIQISPIEKHTPRPSLNIKQLLADKKLCESPSLSGDPDKLIDLETGNLINKRPTGLDNLMHRLLSTVKARKSKVLETCNILSVENGTFEMSEVTISREEAKDLPREAKPGAAYFELKRNLKEIIRKKRMEEIKKKREDELEHSKCLADDDDDEEVDENEDICVEYAADNNKVGTQEDGNVLVAEADGVEISDDDEDSKSNADYDESVVSEILEDESGEENVNFKIDNPIEKSQHKNRIIKGFDDTDDECENDDIAFLKTQPPITQSSLLETETFVRTSSEDVDNELMALCSGTFDDTQKTSVNALMSQIPITQNVDKEVNYEVLMELCSGTFDQSSVPLQTSPPFDEISEKVHTNRKIFSSDEENDDNEHIYKNEGEKSKMKKLSKKLKKRKAKLGFSDDEDEEECEREYNVKEEEVDTDKDDDDGNNSEINCEEPETFVDYDSEENEILVKMTKNEKVERAQNFVENEAELSESEWGSADEDESNLDKYDIELGDDDEFDGEKIQRELGQIHARKMLDEDIREVRKIQELLFEDEEKDGVGRQRTFKWKNAESGFSLDDKRLLDETGDCQNGDSGDEINEHQWRKIRYEREQFLKEQGVNLDSQYASNILDTTTVKINDNDTMTVTTKKLQIITAKKTALSANKNRRVSPFLISNGISAMHKKSARGSFLVRDKEILHKLAGLTKATSSSMTASDMDDAASSVSIKNVKPKNFVFATLTEEEHENLKRKADGVLLNSANENGENFMKKQKIEHRRDKCLIDQLL